MLYFYSLTIDLKSKKRGQVKKKKKKTQRGGTVNLQKN